MKKHPYILSAVLILLTAVVIPVLIFIFSFGLNLSMDNLSYSSTGNYYLISPSTYSPRKTYPLLVYLHGAGQPAGPQEIPFLRLSANLLRNSKVREQINSSYIYLPQTNSKWKIDRLIQQVEEIKAAKQIDTSRVYLIGYSMGGSASFKLANKHYSYNKHLYAAIIRIAGQSETFLEPEIVKHTRVWIHVGLKDLPLRVQIANKAYTNFKNALGTGKELIQKERILFTPVTKHILEENGNKILILSEYMKEGHGISSIPFRTNDQMKWLFSTSIHHTD